VAEGALGGRVPLHDAAVLVDGDDAVERRLQDGGLQRLAVAQRRLHLQPADGRAEQAGEGQQEVLVLPAEAARRSGVRLQHAPGRPAGHPHRHVQQRDDAVPAQQAGPLEAFRRADVLERDGPAGPERAARRRSHAGGERGAADHAGLPADAGADQQVAGLGAVLQDLGPFDAEARRGVGRGFREQRVEVEAFGERAGAEGRDEGLAPGGAGARRRCDVMELHGCRHAGRIRRS
jgi:hypothetical protein